ncbi:MAG: hypothetical protein AAFY19_00795 [Pseudomonadota bacterium]
MTGRAGVSAPRVLFKVSDRARQEALANRLVYEKRGGSAKRVGVSIKRVGSSHVESPSTSSAGTGTLETLDMQENGGERPWFADGSLGQRIRGWLRQRWDRDAAKHAARLTGADVRTARGWVEEGRVPQGDALLAIIREMGRDGLLALFSPEIEAHADRLAREVHEREQELQRLRRQMERARSGDAQGRP